MDQTLLLLGGDGGGVLAGPRPAQGILRPNGRGTADDAGPRLNAAVTAFCLPALVREDADRAERNVAFVAPYGIDFRICNVIGTSGDVPGDSYADRSSDPRKPWFQTNLRATYALIAKYGRRTISTVFGGVDILTTETDRWRALEQSIDVMSDFRETVGYVEIANEPDQTFNERGDPWPRKELWRMAQRVREAGFPLVAIGGLGNEPGFRHYYDGSPATVAAVHTERGRPWPGDARQAYGIQQFSSLAGSDQEPTEYGGNPIAEAAKAATGYVCRVSWVVIHLGSGMRFGGAHDRPRGRQANYFDEPNIETTLKAVAAIRSGLPQDLANVGEVLHTNARFEGRFPFRTGPLQDIYERDFSKIYAVNDGRRFVASLLPTEQGFHLRVPLEAPKPMRVRVHELLDYRVIAERELDTGETLIVGPDPQAAVVEGEYL